MHYVVDGPMTIVAFFMSFAVFAAESMGSQDLSSALLAIMGAMKSRP